MKNRGKKAVLHIGAVIKRMLFIGFTIQIILGFLWMCCNFMQVQDFGGMYFTEGNAYLEQGGRYTAAGVFSPLYQMIFSLLGKLPPVMYLLQTAFAFYCGYHFLRSSLQKRYAVWGSLVLLTFPFAMQCHLAILPYSFLSSFLLLLFSDLRGLWNRESALRSLMKAGVWVILLLAMSGRIGNQRDEEGAERSFEAVMAGRMAWSTLWVDYDRWSEELREMAEEAALQATYYPGNMRILEEAIESRVGRDEAKKYYREIAEVGWTYHAPMIIRQIGWDVLGYGVTPVIFRLQLKGQAYDSYTGRNYEAMRGNAPIVTRYYTEYGCWWFCCSVLLTFVLMVVRLLTGGRLQWKVLLPIAVISCVWIGVLTMEGAGMLDYKYTIAVNELWLIGALLTAFGAMGNREQEIQIEKSAEETQKEKPAGEAQIEKSAEETWRNTGKKSVGEAQMEKSVGEV